MNSRDEMVRKLGKLSKLALNDAEVERFGEQTDKIIGYFRTLQGLDLSGVEPTSHVVDVECFRRPDAPGATLTELGAKFPYLKYGYFQVPRIMPEAGNPNDQIPRPEDGNPNIQIPMSNEEETEYPSPQPSPSRGEGESGIFVPSPLRAVGKRDGESGTPIPSPLKGEGKGEGESGTPIPSPLKGEGKGEGESGEVS